MSELIQECAGGEVRLKESEVKVTGSKGMYTFCTKDGDGGGGNNRRKPSKG